MADIAVAIDVLGPDDAVEHAGTLTLNRVQFELSTNGPEGFSRFQVLDAFSAELCEYHELLGEDDDDEPFHPDLDVGLGGTDMLVLHSLELKRKWRGYGLGLLAVSRAIDTFGPGCSIAAMKPWPMQYTGFRGAPGHPWVPPAGVDPSEKAFKAARSKLQKYWARLGFVRAFPKSELFVLDLSMKRPSVQKLIAELEGKPAHPTD